jgi:hypothetical protein
MEWMVFSYSLPSKARSSPRVALWRQLRRFGAISLAGGAYVLPARDECIEAFQWLAQEVHQAKGDALVMQVDKFEGLNDSQLVDLFRNARRQDYQGIGITIAELERTVVASKKGKRPSGIVDKLKKLRKRHAEIARVDFFDCPEGSRVALKLSQLQQALFPKRDSSAKIVPATIASYRRKRWVTRPRPHVDRLACAWLIRRFINPKASIRYSLRPKPEEISFDMAKAHFGHVGNLCTFETMVAAFGLDEPSLRPITEIVHEIDLRDGRYARPETAGIEAVLKGWLIAGLSDAELEKHGSALFEGLFSAHVKNRKEASKLK